MAASGEIKVPANLRSELAQSPPAQARWDKIPPSHRREYLMWVEEAKQPETRARRIQRTIERLQQPDKR